MADKHESIDMTTLKEVERLLIHTLPANSDVGSLAGGSHPEEVGDPAADDSTPLPKRR